MKPLSHLSNPTSGRTADRHEILPVTARRVEIDFLPDTPWTIEIGTFRPALRSRRQHYRPCVRPDALHCGLAPLELVIAAAQREAACRQSENRRACWASAGTGEIF